MKLRFLVLSFLSIGAACFGVERSLSLSRSAPEAQGVSSADLLAFVEAADQQIDAMNSFMLVRHGQVIAEGWWAPYNAQAKHELYSLSKSFTSTAVGLAVAEGKLSVDDEVLKFFPEDAPAEPSANLKAMRVHDLLRMCAGHQDETSSAPDTICAKTFLAHPVPHKPGTHFRYNTAATFMLSAIVQKQTGKTALEYLRPRLLDPLGIEGSTWQTNWQGISLGGYGLSVRTEDIARLGQLYLQKGQWQGEQLIPEAWVDAATARQTSTGSNPKSDWDQGYGYQFWRCRHNAYRADGAFGQYCLVLPEHDAVVAITSGVKDMQAVLNLIWNKLLPAFQPNALAADPAMQRKLEDKLASLILPTIDGDKSSSWANKIFGREYRFPPNDQKIDAIELEAEPSGKGITLVRRIAGKEDRINCGFGSWSKGTGVFRAGANEPVAGSAGWVAEDTCQIKLCFYETPFFATLSLRFGEGQLFYEGVMNAGFGRVKLAPIVGQAAR